MIPRRDSALIWSRVQVVVVLGAKNRKQLADKLGGKKNHSYYHGAALVNLAAFHQDATMCSTLVFLEVLDIATLTLFQIISVRKFQFGEMFSLVPSCSSPACFLICPCYASFSIRVDGTSRNRWQYLSE